jgi:magnesium-transporting ATPase (P-type)
LGVNEFNSDRKRNSVIIRDKLSDQIFLFCKGADNVILDRTSSDGIHFKPKLQAELEYFSKKGLRTLVFAMRVLSKAEFDAWNGQYQEAQISIGNREERLAEIAEEVEKQLFLIGVTAVEDRLQDNVP